MRLRPATPQDVPRLREIARAAYLPYVERMGREPRPMRFDYEQVVRDLAVTVAEIDGRPVGFVALVYEEQEGGYTVDNVAVDPQHRGTGVGRALLEHAESEARRLGYEEILLYTHSTMTENQALYKRIGYVEYDRRPVDVGEVHYMRKRL